MLPHLLKSNKSWLIWFSIDLCCRIAKEAHGTMGKMKPKSWSAAVQPHSSSLLSSHTLFGKVTAASRASSCPQGNNCRQHAKYSFTLVAFCHLMSGQVKFPDAALLLHLGLLIISVNLIIFYSWRPRAHEHSATLVPKTSEAQESHFSWLRALWSSKSPRRPSFLCLITVVCSLSDLSAMETPWILTAERHTKMVPIQTDFNPSNTCSKLTHLPIASSNFKRTILCKSNSQACNT